MGHKRSLASDRYQATQFRAGRLGYLTLEFPDVGISYINELLNSLTSSITPAAVPLRQQSSHDSGKLAF